MSSRNPENLRRIVEFEVERGNTDEATEWINRGLQKKIVVNSDIAEVQTLVQRLKSEHDE